MINQELAEIFSTMADILQVEGVAWKPQAYRAAARAIETLTFDLKDIYKKGGLKALKEIQGIGEGIAKKIEQYIKTGHVQEYEKMLKKMPSGFAKIVNIPGMGPKKAYKLYRELKIKSLADLKKAINQQKVRKLSGFGILSEENIKKSLGFQKVHKNRRPIKEVLPVANKIVNSLKKLKAIKRISIAGALRRKEKTIGDIDILASSKKPDLVMKKFTSLPDVKKIIAKGPTKSIVILKNGMQADIRVVDDSSYGAALQYFTGNKAHNIKLRMIAIKKGYKLNEYGVFKGKVQLAGRQEKDVYAKLGLRYIPPEKRLNKGEIEANKQTKHL